jgi:acyl-CoA reductase-like NAD-dependent aldehyde dehydrogenase
MLVPKAQLRGPRIRQAGGESHTVGDPRGGHSAGPSSAKPSTTRFKNSSVRHQRRSRAGDRQVWAREWTAARLFCPAHGLARSPGMTIARERSSARCSRLSLVSEQQAVEIANDTVYGLAAYVQSAMPSTRAGRGSCGPAINVNYPDWDTTAPLAAINNQAMGANTRTGASAIFLSSRPWSASARDSWR